MLVSEGGMPHACGVCVLALRGVCHAPEARPLHSRTAHYMATPSDVTASSALVASAAAVSVATMRARAGRCATRKRHRSAVALAVASVDAGLSSEVVVGKYQALTKIRLRTEPNVNSQPTGSVLEAGDIFDTDEVVVDERLAYLRVSGRGWVFHVGISGEWLGRPIIRRLEYGQHRSSDDMREAEAEAAAEKSAAEKAAAKAPQGPSDNSVARLLSWGRTQRTMKIHPAVAARGSHLVVSMPIRAKTPLVGVMADHFIEPILPEDPNEHGPAIPTTAEKLLSVAPLEAWHFQLAMRLVKEEARPRSPLTPYLQSLPRRASAPVLWSDEQVNELQYEPLRRVLRHRASAISDFHSKHLSAESCDLQKFMSYVATANARSVELEPGRHALVPLVDLVGPPETVTDEPSAPSCRVQVEGSGQDTVVLLCAARDLRPGDVLTCDAGVTDDDMVLKHGVAMECENSAVNVTVCVEEGLANAWQAKVLTRNLPVRPGRLPGDLVFDGQIRRSSDVSDALGANIVYAARVLACESEEDLEVFVGDVGGNVPLTGPSMGLVGLYGEYRAACIRTLTRMVRACRGEFPTTVKEDADCLLQISDYRRHPIAYRLGKKLVLDDTLKMLEEESAKAGEGSGALPFAVTGARV